MCGLDEKLNKRHNGKKALDTSKVLTKSYILMLRVKILLLWYVHKISNPFLWINKPNTSPNSVRPKNFYSITQCWWEYRKI